jgi:hypothetical protein
VHQNLVPEFLEGGIRVFISVGGQGKLLYRQSFALVLRFVNFCETSDTQNLLEAREKKKKLK